MAVATIATTGITIRGTHDFDFDDNNVPVDRGTFCVFDCVMLCSIRNDNNNFG